MVDAAIPERFEVVEEIASNDVEILLRAVDRTLQREVVLKAPGPGVAKLLATAADREQALREARALARVQSPGIVRLLEVVDTDAGPLLVLETVPGISLAERLADAEDGRLDPGEVAAIGRALAEALAAVHGAGIVHRGLSTGVVLLKADGTPCLTGFSFAKFDVVTGATSIDYGAAARRESGEDASGGPEPTAVPRHPAPEQLRGQAADARSDIFGLGCVLYECLSGRDPFPEPDPADWTAPAPVGKLVKGVSPALAEAVGKCLARSPLKRFQSAAELAEALAAAGLTAAPMGPVAASVTGQRMARRFGWAAGVLVAAAASIWIWSGTRDDGRPADRGVVLESREGRGGASDVGDYSPEYRHSYALLIGIGDAYAGTGFEPLPNAEDDVEAIAAQLAAMPWEGWEIRKVLGEEATRFRIMEALGELQKDVGEDDRVFIYYAGHGEAYEGSDETGGIIPVDGKPLAQDVGRATWMRFDHFDRFFDETKAKHVLVALDCCYSGRLATARSGTAQKYRERFLRQKAHVVITSGRRFEQVSDGIPGQTSPFANAFLKALDRSDVGTLTGNMGAMTSSMLYSTIQNEILLSGAGQVPQRRNTADSQGEFVFFLRGEE